MYVSGGEGGGSGSRMGSRGLGGGGYLADTVGGGGVFGHLCDEKKRYVWMYTD